MIGTGLAGQRHLEAQVKQGIKTGIYNINSATTKSLRTQSNVIVFKNFQDAINWCNLVHICTPDDMHTEYVAEAIKRGKTVLCEKPLTTNLQDALDLQNLSIKHKSTLIVGQNYRLTPTFMEARKMALEGQIGIITGIETTYLHDMTEYRLNSKARNRQDFLYVGGSHAVDLAYWVANEQIMSIQAAVGNKIKSEYECQERYHIILKFASGFLGHIKLDASSARSTNGTDLIIEGEKGQLVSHNKLDMLLFYERGNKKPKSIRLPNTKTHTIALEVKIIDDYLSGKTDSYWPLPDVNEAVNTIKILDAIEKTISSNNN